MARSRPEVPVRREDHRPAGALAGVDHLSVASLAALPDREADGIEAAHLAGADADGPATLAEDHGLIGPGDKEILDVADDPMQVCQHVMRLASAGEPLLRTARYVRAPKPIPGERSRLFRRRLLIPAPNGMP